MEPEIQGRRVQGIATGALVEACFGAGWFGWGMGVANAFSLATTVLFDAALLVLIVGSVVLLKKGKAISQAGCFCDPAKNSIRPLILDRCGSGVCHHRCCRGTRAGCSPRGVDSRCGCFYRGRAFPAACRDFPCPDLLLHRERRCCLVTGLLDCGVSDAYGCVGGHRDRLAPLVVRRVRPPARGAACVSLRPPRAKLAASSNASGLQTPKARPYVNQHQRIARRHLGHVRWCNVRMEDGIQGGDVLVRHNGVAGVSGVESIKREQPA